MEMIAKDEAGLAPEMMVIELTKETLVAPCNVLVLYPAILEWFAVTTLTARSPRMR